MSSLPRPPRPLLALLFPLLVVLSPACAGQCPPPASDPVSVTPTRAPCQTGDSAVIVPGDPLTLVGGEGFVFGRVDVAAIRRSRYGALMERALDAFIRAEIRGPEAAAFRDGMARTDVLAFGVHLENGATLVAQGRYTDADLDALEMTDRQSRRQHVIHSDHRHQAVVAQGRYMIFAERSGVEAALDRLDGLEDPAPIGGALLAAITASSAYRTYFSLIGIPATLLRREFEREEGLAGVHADLRWGAFTVAQGGSGLAVSGVAHTVTERSANAILAKSEEVRHEAAVALDREVPALATVARALDMRVSGTDATLTLNPSDAEAEAVIEAVTAAFERDAQRRASYSTTATSQPQTTVAAP